jgi:hypothetical protein
MGIRLSMALDTRLEMHGPKKLALFSSQLFIALALLPTHQEKM